jgi:hypothetical protein
LTPAALGLLIAIANGAAVPRRTTFPSAVLLSSFRIFFAFPWASLLLSIPLTLLCLTLSRAALLILVVFTLILLSHYPLLSLNGGHGSDSK